jgi:hypothetical protein
MHGNWRASALSLAAPAWECRPWAWQLLPAASQQCRVTKAEACCPTSRRAPEASLAAGRVWFRADVCVPLQEPEAATVSVAYTVIHGRRRWCSGAVVVWADPRAKGDGKKQRASRDAHRSSVALAWSVRRVRQAAGAACWEQRHPVCFLSPGPVCSLFQRVDEEAATVWERPWPAESARWGSESLDREGWAARESESSARVAPG